MVPELGHFALIIALCFSFALAILPMVGSYTGSALLMNSSRSLASGLFVFIAVAYACLTNAFLNDDFTVSYVANHSNTLLPIFYKFCAVWGGHEGSLLLWVLMLAGWLCAVSMFGKSLPLRMHARVLSVIGMIAIGFLLFILLTSNPFDRLLPGAPSEGSDLNPLLQDPGFVIHPPMLYMGYVGLSVAFAFAISALLSGHLDSAWARWTRPWTTMAWAFLSVGIGLGSWWAYYELGWGGWWFWDPVENASLLPWIVGTALIHSLAVTEKRGLFKVWTILLAIFAFALTLLGTFFIRSGLLTSVHAFATDPTRGAFLLVFLGVVIGGSLILYAVRAPAVSSNATFEWSSREAFLLFNNILLVTAMACVMLGTYYPVIAEAFGMGRVSVGPPFFNMFFVPITIVLCILLGIGSLTQWHRSGLDMLRKYLTVPLILSAVCAIALPLIFADEFKWGGAITVFVGVWVIAATINTLRKQIRNAPSVWAGIRGLRASFHAMVIAHIGLAIAVMGAGLVSNYSQERNVLMEINQPVEVFGYRYLFEGVKQVRGPNYMAQEGTVSIFDGDKLIARLHPQKRFYQSGGSVMTESGLKAGFLRDHYVSLGEAIEPASRGVWAITVHVKPFMRWFWLGIIVMAVGGAIAVIDKRYRRIKVAQNQENEASTRGGREAEVMGT